MKKIFTLLALGIAGITQAQTTSPAPHCEAGFKDPDSVVNIAITSVTLGTFTNGSGGQYTAPHYVFYNNLTAPDLTAGTAATMQVSFNVARNSSAWGAWIDFNHNNVFETTEKVAGSAAGNSYLPLGASTQSATVAIPANATVGLTRMRVRVINDTGYTRPNGASILPCNTGTPVDTLDYGETEDYNVNILGSTPPPNPNGLDFSANRTVGFTNTNFTLSDNNNQNPTSRRWIFIPNKVIYQAATTSGSVRPIVRFTDTGTYSVKLVTTFSNGKDSAQRTDYIRINPFPTGVVPLKSILFGFFPNPATGMVTFTESLHNADLALTNSTGAMVYQATQFSGAQLDMSPYAGGIYFLRVTQAGETFTQKLVLQK